MKWVRNVFPRYDLWEKRLSEIWFGCEPSFWNMVWVRNVFLKYGLGARRLSEIWFGCETSSWTMKTGAIRLSYLWGGGETTFLSMSWGRNGANWLWGAKSVYREYLKVLKYPCINNGNQRDFRFDNAGSNLARGQWRPEPYQRFLNRSDDRVSDLEKKPVD